MGKNAQYALLMMTVGALVAILLSRECSRASSSYSPSTRYDYKGDDEPRNRAPRERPEAVPPSRRSERPRSALGVIIKDVANMSTQEKNDANIRGECSVAITQVLPQSPAVAAGLHSGDCVLMFDNKSLTGSSHLRALAENAGVGKVIHLQVTRGGAPLDVPVKLGAAQTPPAEAVPEPRDARPRLSERAANCPSPSSWDGKVRGWAKLGSPLCAGAIVGYYVRVAINQDREAGLRAMATGWGQLVDKYVKLPGETCPSAAEMVFFDPTGNSGAGILFRERPARWDEIRMNNSEWLLRDASNQEVDTEVCFFLASDGRPTPGWQ